MKDYVRPSGAPEVRAIQSLASTRQPSASLGRESSDLNKPVLLYLPGIELSGYTLHSQTQELGEDFSVHYLTVGQDDRTSFDGLVDVVCEAIDRLANEPMTTATAAAASAAADATSAGDTASEAEPAHLPSAVAPRPVYLLGESFGGALGLAVALRSATAPGAVTQLSGAALVNPATSIGRSWAAQLPALLDVVAALPAGAQASAYDVLAAPILAGISVGDDPLQLLSRRSDLSLSNPLARAATLATRLQQSAAQLPTLLQFSGTLPADTLAFRLAMLSAAAAQLDESSAALRRLKLPIELLASTEDKVLPSVNECRKLQRLLPNARVTELPGSGHVPLLEARVSLRGVLRASGLVGRGAPPRVKDYVSSFAPPSAEAILNATRQLRPIRNLVSPVFLSTKPGGRRVAGLGGLPALTAADADAARAGGDGAGVLPAPAGEPRVLQPNAEGTPPVLFIGNHQLYGFSDLPLVVEEILAQRGALVRALAHPVAFSANRSRAAASDASDASTTTTGGGGGGGQGFVDFETFGAVPVSGKALFSLLRRGEHTLLYPGGVREAFKSTKKGKGRTDESYKLFWPDAAESADFARVAARFNATIVPVAAVGAEEGFEMLLDADELLSLPILGRQVRESAARAPVGRPGERFVSPVSVPKLPGRYYFLFGEPIPTGAVDAADREACAALYTKVQAELEESLRYLLSKREADPYRDVMPRLAVEASWGWERQVPTFRP